MAPSVASPQRARRSTCTACRERVDVAAMLRHRERGSRGAMQAAVMEQAQQPMVIKEVPDPAVGPRDVRIRVMAAGVCHTDLHIADGMLGEFGVDPFPLIPGHETVGVIEETGAEVSDLSVGDRVGVYWIYTCGRCLACLAGEEEACPLWLSQLGANGFTRSGGYAQSIVVPADRAMRLPEGMDFPAAAALFCGGLTMYGALKNAAVRPGQRVGILGIGGLGHVGIMIARAMGAEVIALTSTEAKADLARQLGASHVVCGTETVGEQLQALGGADVVVSTTVDPAPLGPVMQGLAPRGTLVLTGVTLEPLGLVPAMHLFPQHRVIFSLIGSRRDMQELLQLAATNRIVAMTESYPLTEVNAVHDKLRANDVRFRPVLTPN